jgi:hypothetical protein
MIVNAMVLCWKLLKSLLLVVSESTVSVSWVSGISESAVSVSWVSGVSESAVSVSDISESRVDDLSGSSSHNGDEDEESEL